MNSYEALLQAVLDILAPESEAQREERKAAAHDLRNEVNAIVFRATAEADRKGTERWLTKPVRARLNDALAKYPILSIAPLPDDVAKAYDDMGPVVGPGVLISMLSGFLGERSEVKHGHRCSCGTEWVHSEAEAYGTGPVTEEKARWTAAHTCRACGKLVEDKAFWQGPDGTRKDV